MARCDENREVEQYRDREDGSPDEHWWAEMRYRVPRLARPRAHRAEGRSTTLPRVLRYTTGPARAAWRRPCDVAGTGPPSTCTCPDRRTRHATPGSTHTSGAPDQ